MASPAASSMASFHIAHAMPPTREDTGGREAALSEPAKSNKPYRPVRLLPYELKGHVRVFLEERMYSEAIQLLTSLLAAGGSERYADCDSEAAAATRACLRSTPVWIPPPSHLAVLATLMVHPAYTSRTQENTDLRVAGHALQYLRHILSVAGPVQPDFRTAFAFRDVRGRRGGGGSGGGGGAASLGSGFASASVSVSASASASRAHSRLRRLRAPGLRAGFLGGSGSGGGRGDYVDSRTLKFDDDDDYERTNAKLAAGGISVDVLTPAPGRWGNGGGGGGGDGDGDPDSAYSLAHMGGGAVDADTDMDADDDAVSGRMATRDSVWTRGQDFWRVAGWALSCSVEEPLRWRYWQPWLALVVDVLEADLAARLAEGAPGAPAPGGAAAGAAKGTDADETPLQKSLLFSYLQGWGGHSQLRHLASAIVTDGSQAAHLREVFDKETATTAEGAAGTATAAAIRLFDLDSTKFGDYSDDESPPSTPLHVRDERSAALAGVDSGSGYGSNNDSSSSVTIPNSGNDPGYLESVPLRRRLFYLVVLAAMCFPEDFAPVDVVYRTFSDVLRETCVTVFSSFVTLPPPAASAALWSATAPPPITADDAFIGLFRHILFTVLPLSAPKPRVVDPDADSHLGVSQRMLERCFLPFAANTVVLGANVRMALVLESLFRIVWGGGSSGGRDGRRLCWTAALQEAAETGVRARDARPRPPKKKAFEVEAFGRDLMWRSGRRLLLMVQLARMEANG